MVNVELEVKEQEVNATPQRVMALQESARKRMAEYLHGQVQTKLIALQVYLSRCQELIPTDPGQASELLQRSRNDLQRVQDDDIRQLSHSLYPSIIKLGLLPALRSLSDRLSVLIPIQLLVGEELPQVDTPNGDGAFTEEFKLGVYRIIEEALGNVIKHSSASQATATLHFSKKGFLSLSVKDNGRRFDVKKVSLGMGLTAIRDYAEALRGSCNVESAPGQGTKVVVILPVRVSATTSRQTIPHWN